jgi:hypothetical protein
LLIVVESTIHSFAHGVPHRAKCSDKPRETAAKNQEAVKNRERKPQNAA